MQRILIIGATSGIGRALVEVLRARGFTVIAAGRRQALLDSLGGETVTMDATQPEAIDQIAALAPDGIIFSAGFGCRSELPDGALTQQAIDLNVTAFERVAQWALTHCSFFATIASIAGLRGMEYTNGYSPSKAYMMTAMEAYRRLIRARGLSCHFMTIIPGFVDTAMGQASKFWRCSPAVAAECIARGIMRRKSVLYVTARWRLVALLLWLTPRFIYERIKFQ